MSLFESASLVVTPNGTKASKLYAIKPTDGSGDLSVTRATSATRVNASGVIETVGANVPRLDYSNGSCPSILVEPQRTNLALRSEEFDNVSWVKVNTTITANAIISPDGTINADLCNYTAGSGSYINAGAIFAGNSDVVISVFVKANTISIFRIRESFYTGVSCVFDLSAQTAGTNGKIENYGNGWYRCSFKYNLSLGQTNINFIFDSNTATGSLYLWGAQIEAGSYATSYIPTVASSVTRNADVISKLGISSLIGQTEGTMFVNFVKTHIQDESLLLMIYDNSSVSGKRLQIVLDGNNFLFYVQKDPSFSIGTPNIPIANGNNKIAVSYGSNGYKVYLNGISVYTNASAIVPETNSFNLGSFPVGVVPISDGIKSAILFKRQLTNSELSELTTI